MVNSLYEDALQMMPGGGMTDDDADPTLLVRTVGDAAASHVRVLNFLLLGCEPKMPYGPIRHTAELVLDSLAQALTEAIRLTLAEQQQQQHEQRRKQANGAGTTDTIMMRDNDDNVDDTHLDDTYWMLRMRTYNAQLQEYPATAAEYDQYDGIVLPGSFAAAYDQDEPWIARLSAVIQTHIVPSQRKTLGICFGHQIMAHSFGNGRAAAMGTFRGGRRTLQTTAAGKALLSGSGGGVPSSSLDYYYTHGDYVQTLPPTAVSLGGDDQVPILAAAYYGGTPPGDQDILSSSSSSSKPYAITFQAHPEYASSMDLGLYRTLNMILDVAQQKGTITAAQRDAMRQDATESFDRVQRDSLQTLVSVGQVLGWFPGGNHDKDED